MNKENCMKKERKDKDLVKNIKITIKINKSCSDWLKENNLSPTAVFNEAIKELGYTES